VVTQDISQGLGAYGGLFAAGLLTAGVAWAAALGGLIQYVAAGGALMMRRPLFLAVGGFDKGLFDGSRRCRLGTETQHPATGTSTLHKPGSTTSEATILIRSECTTAASRILLALLAKNP